MARYPVSISLDEKELKILNRLAKKLHQTRSALLKAALAEYIRKLEFERLRQIGQAWARSKGLFTDDDVFNLVS